MESSAQLWAFVVFSLVGSFTPGPNTTIATITGANFGFRAAVPHILGVPFGFSTLLALGALGVAGLWLSVPAAAGAVKWAGIAYLLYLAWALARAALPSGAGAPGMRGGRPLTFLESALFQYANPKAWMLAVAAAGTYAGGARIAERTAPCSPSPAPRVSRPGRGRAPRSPGTSARGGGAAGSIW